MIVDHDGQREEYTSSIVVVSCGAANSARLLLMSANEKHPRGLANGSDMVGRHYMFHNAIALVALSKRENPTEFQKTLTINDFYLGAPDYEFPLGNIQMLGKSKGPMFHDDAPKFAPRLHARPDGAARGGFLAHRRRPAAAAQPRHREFSG